MMKLTIMMTFLSCPLVVSKSLVTITTNHAFFIDELLTLLGTGALAEEDMEELLAISSSRGREEGYRRESGRPSSIYHDSLVAQEIRSWVTLADRAATGSSSTATGGASSSGGVGGGASKSKSSSQSVKEGGSAAVHFGVQSCWGEKEVWLSLLMYDRTCTCSCISSFLTYSILIYRVQSRNFCLGENGLATYHA